LLSFCVLQEDLTIVHFLNKLIVSCKEAVRFLSNFVCVIFKLDSYFLFKLKGYFLYFTPIVIKHLKNAEKTNNAPNYVERFKVPTVLLAMFNM
jgi:hypothetical protein